MSYLCHLVKSADDLARSTFLISMKRRLRQSRRISLSMYSDSINLSPLLFSTVSCHGERGFHIYHVFDTRSAPSPILTVVGSTISTMACLDRSFSTAMLALRLIYSAVLVTCFFLYSNSIPLSYRADLIQQRLLPFWLSSWAIPSHRLKPIHGNCRADDHRFLIHLHSHRHPRLCWQEIRNSHSRIPHPQLDHRIPLQTSR